MKKLMIIILALGLTIILQPPLRAQHLYNSYGLQQAWYLPDVILHNIHWNYPNYDVSHVSRIPYYGAMHFNVILKKGNFFYELRFNEYGHVINRVRHHYFPLVNHLCTGHCGYHQVYYRHHIKPYIHVHNHHNMHHKYAHNKKHKEYGQSEQHAKKHVTEPRKPVEVQSRTNDSRVSRVNPNRNRDNAQANSPRTQMENRRPQTSNVGSSQVSRSPQKPQTSRSRQQVRQAPQRPQTTVRQSDSGNARESNTNYRNNSRTSRTGN